VHGKLAADQVVLGLQVQGAGEVLHVEDGAEHALEGGVALLGLLGAGGEQVDSHVEGGGARAVFLEVAPLAAGHVQHLAIVGHVELDEEGLDVVVEAVRGLQGLAPGMLGGVVLFHGEHTTCLPPSGRRRGVSVLGQFLFLLP
jgi:hypothetical protein